MTPLMYLNAMLLVGIIGFAFSPLFGA